MQGSRSIGGMPAAGLALAGMLAGHWLTYLMVRPTAHTRAALLASAGHGYLAAAVEAAVLLALMAAAGLVLSRLHRTTDGPRIARVALGLWCFQLATFAALELTERAVAGSFDGLLAVLLVGTAAQFLVAVVTAWLMGLMVRIADGASDLARAWEQVPAVATVIAVRPPLQPPMPALLRADIRAPPSSA
jgi:hypothetical protein